MTEVLFYSNVPDRLRTACQLSAKAMDLKRRVMILTSGPALTEQVSNMLWNAPSVGFNPHCRASSHLAPMTPIIVDHASDNVIHDDVLINLCDETPGFFSRFHRLIEIVSSEENDRLRARDRYRFYRDRGYEITTHDLSKSRA